MINLKIHAPGFSMFTFMTYSHTSYVPKVKKYCLYFSHTLIFFLFLLCEYIKIFSVM